YPVYLSGTSTQLLQRLHFAVTRPEAPSILRMAFLITTSAALFTTSLAVQTGQRASASWTAPVSVMGRFMAVHSPYLHRICQEYPYADGISLLNIHIIYLLT